MLPPLSRFWRAEGGRGLRRPLSPCGGDGGGGVGHAQNSKAGLNERRSLAWPKSREGSPVTGEAPLKSSLFILTHRCNLQQPSLLRTASGQLLPPPEPRSPPYGQMCATSCSPAEVLGRPHLANAGSLGLGGRQRPLNYSSHHPQRTACESSFSSRWVLPRALVWAAAPC